MGFKTLREVEAIQFIVRVNISRALDMSAFEFVLEPTIDNIKSINDVVELSFEKFCKLQSKNRKLD